ncbi:hypothetical protein D3C75_951650 [compost metagenome]
MQCLVHIGVVMAGVQVVLAGQLAGLQLPQWLVPLRRCQGDVAVGDDADGMIALVDHGDRAAIVLRHHLCCLLQTVAGMAALRRRMHHFTDVHDPAPR